MQFAHADFVAHVLGAVKQAAIDPARLKLELTKSMLVQDLDDIVAKMRALKAHGIGFSLDDFGTGFSSLSCLRHLPLDRLRIDKAFVSNRLESNNDAAIARTVVELGRRLGLQQLGCNAVQGYLYSKPLPIAQFDALAAQFNGERRSCTATGKGGLQRVQ
jgi:EAL domain-containing protein (putative c-di-GMP-specific phosphodiesterase class I)